DILHHFLLLFRRSGPAFAFHLLERLYRLDVVAKTRFLALHANLVEALNHIVAPARFGYSSSVGGSHSSGGTPSIGCVSSSGRRIHSSLTSSHAVCGGTPWSVRSSHASLVSSCAAY